MKLNDRLVPLILLTAFSAIPLASFAQEEPVTEDAAPSTLGATDTGTVRTTDTGTLRTTGTGTLGSTDTGTLGTTGTGTLGSTDTGTLGTTGTGTLGTTGTGTIRTTDTGTLMAAPSPWTMQAASASITGPGSITINVSMRASERAEPGESMTYTLLPTTTDRACSAPAEVSLSWTPTTGGDTSFTVTCKAVTSNRQVAVAAGSSKASFILKASP